MRPGFWCFPRLASKDTGTTCSVTRAIYSDLVRAAVRACAYEGRPRGVKDGFSAEPFAVICRRPGAGRSNMDDDLSRAAHYREKAESLRKIAEDDATPDTRAALLSVAEQYERICA